MSDDRESISRQAELITDPDLKAKKEIENGFRQFDIATAIIKDHIGDAERPFSLRPRHLLQLNGAALEGIHSFAGAFRNVAVEISGSRHVPPPPYLVPEEINLMCDYVNNNWQSASPIHLASYTLWKINWIHPFADGNGRTARATSYLVMSVRLSALLPGKPTIPEQISEDKGPYYEALEAADKAWIETGSVDVSSIESILNMMLATQLLAAAREAAGMTTKAG